MGLTPVELEGREFSKARKGYNCEEVDKFFKLMAQEFEALYRENLDLKDNCSRLRQDLERYKNLENTITETLVTAQKAAENSRNNAIKEAEVIIQEAKVKAEEMMVKVRGEIQQQEADLRELVKQHQVAAAEMKLFLTTHLELLEKHSRSLTLTRENRDAEDGEEVKEDYIKDAPEVYLEV